MKQHRKIFLLPYLISLIVLFISFLSFRQIIYAKSKKYPFFVTVSYGLSSFSSDGKSLIFNKRISYEKEVRATLWNPSANPEIVLVENYICSVNFYNGEKKEILRIDSNVTGYKNTSIDEVIVGYDNKIIYLLSSAWDGSPYQIWITDTGGISNRKILEIDGFVSNIDYSPTGKIVYVLSSADEGDSIWLMDIESGKSDRVWDAKENYIKFSASEVIISIDGKKILCNASKLDGSGISYLYLIDAQTKQKYLVRKGSFVYALSRLINGEFAYIINDREEDKYIFYSLNRQTMKENKFAEMPMDKIEHLFIYPYTGLDLISSDGSKIVISNGKGCYYFEPQKGPSIAVRTLDGKEVFSFYNHREEDFEKIKEPKLRW